MPEDHFHDLFNDGVLLSGKALSVEIGRVGRWVLMLELGGEGEDFLFGDEAFLFEQAAECGQLLHRVDTHFTQIE